METRIKERLVGAIALVVIVVIVVPELLTGPRAPAPRPAAPTAAPVHTVTIDLAAGERGAIARPPPPAPDATSTAGPAAPAAATTGSAAAEPATPAPEATATISPATSAPASAPTTIATGAPTPAPSPTARVPEPKSSVAAPKPAPAAGAEGWVVQLGSFASRDNAETLAKALRSKGYRAFVSEFRGSGRVLYRVRVGPEQDRARADAIAARLAREGHRGSVAPQP